LTLTINRATPTITWATPAAITYGTALSATQLNATASVAGTFAYSPASGTVPTAGTQTLSVTFTPTNTSYNSVTATVPLVVNKVTPTLNWTTPSAITYGTALNATQLNATASVAGTFAYSPASGTVLTAGTQPLSVTFTPTNTSYNSVTATVTLTVNQVTPIITWATPTAITYPTPFEGLPTPTANVQGTFTYFSLPPIGWILMPATASFNTTFTPKDTTNYTTATATVQLVINKAILTVTANSISRVYGAANPTFTATIASFVNGDTQSSAVNGTPSLSSSAGSTSPVGAYIINVGIGSLTSNYYTFTPANGTLTITRATPTINWAPPAAVTYGTPLSATQLNATASVAGTLVYSPASGTVLTAGTQTLSVTFTPTDTTDYSTATGTVTQMVSPASPTLIFTAIATKTYGVSSFTVSASSASTGAITYSVNSGPATISGSTVTITGAGTVVLGASQAATTNYTAATASTSFTVSPATPTLSFTAIAAKTYGVSPFTVSASSASTGAITYSVTSGPATISGSTVTITGAGTVVLGASQAATTNYTAATASTSFTVRPATPTLSFTAIATQTYGVSPFTVSASSASTGAITYSVTSGPATISGSTVTITGAGTVVLGASQAATTNYTAATASTSFTVRPATPTLSFTAIATQTYGVSPFTVSASSASTGAITYSVTSGPATISGSTVTITGAGTVVLGASQAATTNYTAGTATTGFTVSPATPTLSFTAIAAKTYGVSPFTVSASSASTGAITYSVTSGPATISGSTVTITGAGTVVLGASQAATTNYTAATASTSFTVSPATPVITWPTPSAVTNGTALSATQLNATASTPGTFVYSPASGTVPTVGTQTLSVTFTPTDTTDYNSATATATLTVNKATPAINWATPGAITYGTALSATQLNATASVAGTFAYSPASGTVPTAGTQVLSVTFTPTDTTDYNSVTAIVTLTVNSAQSGQETPDISWLTPAAISYGTALSSTQLNASASYNGTVVPGTFEYTPAAGEVLDSGSQTLLVAFFPNDSTTYSTAGGSVQLQVIPSASDLPQTFYYYCIPDPSNNYCSSFGYNSAGPGYDGAGNLKYSIDLVTGSWSFNYDTLNRLIAGMPAPGSSANNGNNLCWSYDPFGNRTAQSSQNTPCPTLPSTPTQTVYYNTNNQITGGLVTYDAAGDVAMDTNAGNTYLYDGEGRICAVMSEPVPNNSTMTAYVYDAEGNRVAKGVISSWPTNGLCPNLAAAGVFTPTASYVLGPSNEQLTETDGQGQWQHTNVYAAGTIIATYDQVSNPLYTNGGTQPAKVPALHFQLEDWLGSRRVQTNITGTVEEWYVSLPYGDGLTPIPNLGCLPSNNCYSEDPTEHHFTGKERDAETGFANGNDYFGARYYASSMGRWMSPDWSAKVEPVPYSKLDDPQTLNLYAYVGNNPLTRVDPDGHTEPIRFGCSEGQKDCNTDQQKAQQQNGQATTSSSTPSDPIVNALQKDVPGVATVTPTADKPFDQGGHKNETDALTFKTPEDQAKFLAEASRKGLAPGDVSKNGFGPGVRLDGGLHAEKARLDPLTGRLTVTSHIDRFNPNNGLGPMVGHAVVDVFIGSVFFRHSAGLD
jgi:RHS repeat-associated protein